jgi:hypothetical protein
LRYLPIPIFTKGPYQCAVLEKLPTAEVEKWIQYSHRASNSQLAPLLEKFITERWAYSTIVVSRTTSAELALKSVGIGSGGGGGQQQGGSKPGSPRFKKKNWKEKKSFGGGGNGANLVPVATAQPDGGEGGQAAQPSTILAAGTVAQGGGKGGAQGGQARSQQ